jgi:hypothetical protein
MYVAEHLRCTTDCGFFLLIDLVYFFIYHTLIHCLHNSCSPPPTVTKNFIYFLIAIKNWQMPANGSRL